MGKNINKAKEIGSIKIFIILHQFQPKYRELPLNQIQTVPHLKAEKSWVEQEDQLKKKFYFLLMRRGKNHFQRRKLRMKIPKILIPIQNQKVIRKNLKGRKNLNPKIKTQIPTRMM